MRNVLDKAEPEKKRTAEVHCIHYWIIETTDGPTSRGVCKYCGAEMADMPSGLASIAYVFPDTV